MTAEFYTLLRLPVAISALVIQSYFLEFALVM